MTFSHLSVTNLSVSPFSVSADWFTIAYNIPIGADDLAVEV
jgi:hypothetical protein